MEVKIQGAGKACLAAGNRRRGQMGAAADHLAAGTVMQTWKNAAGVEVLEETFVVTPEPGTHRGDATRRIVVLIMLKNTTRAKAMCQPALRIKSVLPVAFSSNGGVAVIGKDTRIVASDAVQAWEAKPKADGRMLLPAVTLAPGTSRQVVFTIDRGAKQPTHR